LRRLASLPLVTLYLTERCNSRCVSCDYWRHGRLDVDLARVTRLLPELKRLGTDTVLISGGEPLIHPQWTEIATTLRGGGLELWLLTSGLSLVKHAPEVARLFRAVTVSLDAIDAPNYAAIRGLDAFDNVCAGIRTLADLGLRPGVRVTVQRRNYRDLSGFVSLAQRAGAHQVSFLAADVRNPTAFGRGPDFASDIALRAEDLMPFALALDALERDYQPEFRTGFIAESPLKLRRLWQYYAALCGQGPFPPTRCNAPEFSAVIEANGRVSPCFFIRGPAGDATAGELSEALNDTAMLELRADIRAGRRAECVGCVCTMWRKLSS